MTAFVTGFTGFTPVSTRSNPSSQLPKCCANEQKAHPNPPTNLESTVQVATQAITAAVKAGHKRILINALIPGLNPLVEQTVPFSASLLNVLAKGLIQYTPELNAQPTSSLLFQSAGTAAAATAQYARSATSTEQTSPDEVKDEANATADTCVTSSSFSKRDIVPGRTSDFTNVIIAPISSRGDPIMEDLESVIKENGQATWILLNPDLGADRAAVGMRESTRRAQFTSSFVNTFYFRNLFEIQRPTLKAVERGALLFCYGQPWRIFALIDDQYVLAEELQSMPSADQIDSIIMTANAKASRDALSSTPSGFDVEIRRLFDSFNRRD